MANPQKAKDLSRFFKTGKGEYGEGDVFLGIMVPLQRQLAKKYHDLDLKDLQRLLSSKVHEHRLTSLMILVLKFSKAKEKEQKEIVDFYLKNTKKINNWDLVDLSAHYILGKYYLKLPQTNVQGINTNTLSGAETSSKRKNHSRILYTDIKGKFREDGFDKDKKVLYQLARSKNLWEKRIGVMATFWFIKNNQFTDSLKIAEILLKDKHDLIHKAVGWMLREVGNRDLKTEEEFLKKHYKNMPRTMLRYAIEKFPEPKRQAYLK